MMRKDVLTSQKERGWMKTQVWQMSASFKNLNQQLELSKSLEWREMILLASQPESRSDESMLR